MQQRKPEWLRIKVQGGQERAAVEALLAKLSLHTVCEEAGCPNMMECFSKSTATFMILGRICSRNCTFCNVEKGNPGLVDANEPDSVAKAVAELKLKHAVITSVTRDDLPDGGAAHFASVIGKVRQYNENVTLEVLIPDFRGNIEALDSVIYAEPEVINHNIETVPRLYPAVRPMALYTRSLELLKHVKNTDGDIFTKSGIMVGLGEMEGEVVQVLEDLRSAACDFLTIGQYLAPSRQHLPVVEYIHPDIFDRYKETALRLGFKHVASGPLVRSSYHAHQALEG
jgi:lipoyl synthase